MRVWVQASNESPPRFVDKLYTANLVENSPVGSLVAVVTALDNDEVSIGLSEEHRCNQVYWDDVMLNFCCRCVYCFCKSVDENMLILHVLI